MIRVRLQIGDAEIKDMYDTYGFIYLSSDHIFAAPTRGFETTTYAEEAGEHVDPRTVDDAFDYKVVFLIEAPNTSIASANAKIKAFNDLMYTTSAGIKTFKTFTFLNSYKRVKIVGIPSPISEAKEFWRDNRGVQHDCVQVEWTIRVTDPSLCNFNYGGGISNRLDTISASYFLSESPVGTWNFTNGWKVMNNDGKTYSYSGDYIKFSRNVNFYLVPLSSLVPKHAYITTIQFIGSSNDTEQPANLATFNGVNMSNITFPIGATANYALDFTRNPIKLTGASIPFSFSGAQAKVSMRIYTSYQY